MYKKNIKPFFPSGSRNIILIVLVIGIGAFFYGLNRDVSITALGLLIFLISVIILTGHYGIQVDFEKYRFRSYLSFIYLLRFGNWQELPEIKEITVIPLKHFVSRHSLQGNIYAEKFQIKLLGDGSGDSITISHGLYGELILEAEELSKKLGIPIRKF